MGLGDLWRRLTGGDAAPATTAPTAPSLRAVFPNKAFIEGLAAAAAELNADEPTQRVLAELVGPGDIAITVRTKPYDKNDPKIPSQFEIEVGRRLRAIGQFHRTDDGGRAPVYACYGAFAKSRGGAASLEADPREALTTFLAQTLTQDTYADHLEAALKQAHDDHPPADGSLAGRLLAKVGAMAVEERRFRAEMEDAHHQHRARQELKLEEAKGVVEAEYASVLADLNKHNVPYEITARPISTNSLTDFRVTVAATHGRHQLRVVSDVVRGGFTPKSAVIQDTVENLAVRTPTDAQFEQFLTNPDAPLMSGAALALAKAAQEADRQEADRAEREQQALEQSREAAVADLTALTGPAQAFLADLAVDTSAVWPFRGAVSSATQKGLDVYELQNVLSRNDGATASGVRNASALLAKRLKEMEQTLGAKPVLASTVFALGDNRLALVRTAEGLAVATLGLTLHKVGDETLGQFSFSMKALPPADATPESIRALVEDTAARWLRAAARDRTVSTPDGTPWDPTVALAGHPDTPAGDAVRARVAAMNETVAQRVADKEAVKQALRDLRRDADPLFAFVQQMAAIPELARRGGMKARLVDGAAAEDHAVLVTFGNCLEPDDRLPAVQVKRTAAGFVVTEGAFAERAFTAVAEPPQTMPDMNAVVDATAAIAQRRMLGITAAAKATA